MSEYLPDNYTHNKFIKNIDGKFHYHSQISKESEIISEAVLVLKPSTRLSDVRIDTEECDRLVLKDALSKVSPTEKKEAVIKPRITEEQLGESVSLTFYVRNLTFRQIYKIRWLSDSPKSAIKQLFPEVESEDVLAILEGISLENRSVLMDVEERPLIAVARVLELILSDEPTTTLWDVEYVSDNRQALLRVNRDGARVVDFDEIVKFYQEHHPVY